MIGPSVRSRKARSLQHDTPAAPAVRETLERMLASETFATLRTRAKAAALSRRAGAGGRGGAAEGLCHRRRRFRQGRPGSILRPTPWCGCRPAGCANCWPQYFADEGAAEPLSHRRFRAAAMFRSTSGSAVAGACDGRVRRRRRCRMPERLTGRGHRAGPGTPSAPRHLRPAQVMRQFSLFWAAMTRRHRHAGLPGLPHGRAPQSTGRTGRPPSAKRTPADQRHPHPAAEDACRPSISRLKSQASGVGAGRRRAPHRAVRLRHGRFHRARSRGRTTRRRTTRSASSSPFRRARPKASVIDRPAERRDRQGAAVARLVAGRDGIAALDDTIADIAQRHDPGLRHHLRLYRAERPAVRA